MTLATKLGSVIEQAVDLVAVGVRQQQNQGLSKETRFLGKMVGLGTKDRQRNRVSGFVIRGRGTPATKLTDALPLPCCVATKG